MVGNHDKINLNKYQILCIYFFSEVLKSLSPTALTEALKSFVLLLFIYISYSYDINTIINIIKKGRNLLQDSDLYKKLYKYLDQKMSSDLTTLIPNINEIFGN